MAKEATSRDTYVLLHTSIIIDSLSVDAPTVNAVNVSRTTLQGVRPSYISRLGLPSFLTKSFRIFHLSHLSGSGKSADA